MISGTYLSLNVSSLTVRMEAETKWEKCSYIECQKLIYIELSMSRMTRKLNIKMQWWKSCLDAAKFELSAQ